MFTGSPDEIEKRVQKFMIREKKAICRQARRISGDSTLTDRKPKWAKTLFLQIPEPPKSYKLDTPFGHVFLQRLPSGVMAYTSPDCRKESAWSYGTIVRHLDSCILGYLRQLDIETPIEIITQILNFLEGKQFRYIQLFSGEFKSAAACLCGTLSCSEPSRIQDGGKWERAAMRSVLKRIEKMELREARSCTEIFKPMFSGSQIEGPDIEDGPIFLLARKKGFELSRDVFEVGRYTTQPPDSEGERFLKRAKKHASQVADDMSSDSEIFLNSDDEAEKSERPVVRDEQFQKIYNLFSKYKMVRCQQHKDPLYGIRYALSEDKLREEIGRAYDTFERQIEIWYKSEESKIREAMQEAREAFGF
jgi:hypothetical protein